MGSEPTHPELLEWLAGNFRDGRQSLKELHRLLVTSRTYRQASDERAQGIELDASNRLLWRMSRRRLKAEELRDSILAVSGALDRKMGGPGYYLFELEKTEHSPHFEYHKFDPANKQSHRRSIYRFIARSQPDPWMTYFDCADSSQSSPKRIETLTALQALSLQNSKFTIEMSRILSRRLAGSSDSTSEQVRLAFQWVLQRNPTESELTELVSFTNEHGLPNLARLLFNLNEFVYID